MGMRARTWAIVALPLAVAACSKDHAAPSSTITRTETREACAERDPLRRPLYGDLHVHTARSWDAYGFGTRLLPADAYRFARGEAVELPPTDADGRGTRRTQLARPLDFAAVTDHSEFIAEVRACLDPASGVYDVAPCQTYRAATFASQAVFGISLVPRAPQRLPSICGAKGIDCAALASDIWSEVRAEAEDAYDRTASCRFTSFVGYEWTGATGIASLHRNVIFRNDDVPPAPISYYERSSPEGLWQALHEQCKDKGGRCDVLAIPHNSNLSNGNMFVLETEAAGGLDELRERARARAEMEPVMEIFQHKGDSECRNGLTGFAGAPDELCGFEKVEPFEGTSDCGEGSGFGGVIGTGLGCRSARDYARGALLLGLQQDERIGVNPYKLGFIASTDTHNATPGNVAEATFPGHQGAQDASPEQRLTPTATDAQILNNPGGLAGVWAEENSRDAIFEALRRRETFGTSGPRIVPRFFGGWGYPEDVCSRPDLVARGYRDGVPMGGDLPRGPGDGRSPVFVVSALRDPDGAPLERVQIVKGWLDLDGTGHYRTYDVGDSGALGASVNPDTCETQGTGADALCARWADPDFDPSARAYYYARVVENPTCRWSTRECNALPQDQRPAVCADEEHVPKVVRERAWTSAIWYQPAP